MRRPSPHHRSSPSRPRTGLSPFCSHVLSRCWFCAVQKVRLPCVDAERPRDHAGSLGHGKRRRRAIPRSDAHLAHLR